MLDFCGKGRRQLSEVELSMSCKYMLCFHLGRMPHPGITHVNNFDSSCKQ